MLMMPLVWLLNTITRILMRMMGIKTDIIISGALSKDELRTIVNESRSQISRRNQDMLLSVLDLEKSALTTSWCRAMKLSVSISTTTGNLSSAS
jgi:Mg2+/Co2+ transporter CorB